MDKIKKLRITENDSFIDLPIGANASDVDMANGSNVQESISQLNTNKLDKSDVTSYVHSEVTGWLDDNVTPAGSTVVVDQSLSIQGAAADAKKTGDQISGLKEDLNTKVNTDGSYETLTVGHAKQLIGDNYTEENMPYLFRKVGGSAEIGNREADMLVGGTVAWNQLATDFANRSETLGVTITANNTEGSITVTGTAISTNNLYFTNNVLMLLGHVYLLRGSKGNGYLAISEGMSARDTGNGVLIKRTGATNPYRIVFGFNEGDVLNEVLYPQLFDLTQMFGTTIADYIYSLERATAGAGVEFFRKLFPKDYYEYNAGELISVSGVSAHEMTGFNQWDEEWEVGSINFSNGEKIIATDRIRSKNYIPVMPNTLYHFNSLSDNMVVFYYDSEKRYLGTYSYRNANQPLYTTPANCHYIMFYMVANYGVTYKNNICINFSDPTRNGEYEPYKKHSYPLDDSLTLRGIPKLDANNNLYYDGDTYEHDGTVTRRYGVVDLGTLNWTKTTASSLDVGYYFQTGLSLSKGGSLNCILDKYVLLDKIGLSANVAAYGSNINKVAFRASNNNLYIIDSTYTTAEDFKVAMSGVYLVYELAMPITETADTFTEYQSVDKYGTEEYVSTSIVPVGHVTKYYENLTQKIERLPKDFSTLIAPTEYTYTAMRNYTIGSLFIVNNILYKATANIANGGNITPGTNCIATTLAEIISALT